MEKIIIDSQDYQEKSQRIGNTVAWLDEALHHDLIPHLKKALNERDMKQKDTILCALLTYWSGISDGNRFNRSYPYSDSNPPVNDPNGTRVVYLELIK
jgi:enterochelin esterase-like enzyme